MIDLMSVRGVFTELFDELKLLANLTSALKGPVVSVFSRTHPRKKQPDLQVVYTTIYLLFLKTKR